MITERRFNPSQIRAGDAAAPSISGMAARYDSLSEDLGGFRERLAPGCFGATLKKGHDIKMLFSHDPSKLLGSTRAGTLALNETQSGLCFRCILPDTPTAREVHTLVKDNLLRECSFGFNCEDEDWSDEDDPESRSRKIPVRRVKRAHLHEISAVAFPAYGNGATNVGIDAGPMALAAAASRSLFPGGLIPAEIRSHVPGLRPYRPLMTPEERELYSTALLLESQAELYR
jgi:HK97 family phage prohead protease